MPNNTTQLYHKNPNLQVVLDFLVRCTTHDQQMTALYQHAHQLTAVKAACAALNIHPADSVATCSREHESLPADDLQPCLILGREDWLLLAESAMPLLAQELRKRLPAINAALKLVPVPWDALSLPDGALAAWGTAASMIALPGRTVFDYFGSRYPGDARQRGRYSIVRDVNQAAAYRMSNAFGFLLAKEGTQNFACRSDSWRDEAASARAMLDGHLSLMLKIGLQMLEAGATCQLQDLRTVLALAGESPSLVRIQILFETYEEHVASYGAGQNRFRSTMLKNCMDQFQHWQASCGLPDSGEAAAGHRDTPVRSTREWKWVETGVEDWAPGISCPGPAMAVPGTPPAASPTTATMSPAMSTTTTKTTPTTPAKATGIEPMIAEGVIIPKGVTVARGAHVRVCTISANTSLKPGTILHGDVSIASHTRFDGPLTIMHDVRIGWGLTFSAGLILTEGATISTFAVKRALPRGTRISGSLRIGEGVTVGGNVSFGAENWIGNHVRIGANVRFGPYVQVDDGVSIGANAWIKGHARLIGAVPMNAEVDCQAGGRNTVGEKPAGPPYAIHISAFSITKNETIRERMATPRPPLATGSDAGPEHAADLPPAAQRAGSPHCLADETSANRRLPSCQDGAAIRGGSTTVSPPSAHADSSPGIPRKRGGDVLAGRSTKRVCTGLELRYKDAETEYPPAVAERRPDHHPPKKSADLTRRLNKSAFLPVQATSTSGMTSTSTSTSTAWLDQQGPTSVALPEAAKQRAPELPMDRAAQRKAWESLVISKENQSGLERAMRQSIRVPIANACAKPDERMPEPMTRHAGPMAAIKGPNM